MPIVYFTDQTQVSTPAPTLKGVELGDRQVALLAENDKIVQVGDKWYGAGFEDTMMFLIEHPSYMDCDFCQSPIVKFIYETGEHSDWAACEVCAQAIEQKDWDYLARRATDTAVRNRPSLVDNTVEMTAAQMMIRALHSAFAESMTGSRTQF